MALIGISLKAAEHSGPWMGPRLYNSQRETMINPNIDRRHGTNSGQICNLSSSPG